MNMNHNDSENEIDENGTNENDLFSKYIGEYLNIEDYSFEPSEDKDYKPYIIIDKRENRSEIGKELKNLGAIVIEKTLDTGDYLISSNSCVERKRGDDFYSSVFSGSNKTNIFEELTRLKKAVSKPILILENFQKMFEKNKEVYSSLYGALSSISLDLMIPIIPTRDYKDTALLLYRMAIREQTIRVQKSIARRIPKNISLRESQAYFLEGFFNVGPTKAKQILDHFENPLNFITALIQTEIIYSKNGKPKGIKGPLSEIKGFGWKFVEANKDLLLKIENPESE
ncbi:MAG: ERCC4 domain-containing protein [Promethearchaeota archaeon]